MTKKQDTAKQDTVQEHTDNAASTAPTAARKAPRSYADATIAKTGTSQVEITGSIPADVWGAYRKEAVKNLNDSVSLPGFRKGNIPEHILASKIGEMPILEEMAELAIPKAYVEILVDNTIDAIGKPSIHVTKLAAGNPLEFKAVTAVVPEVMLPDYAKIAAGEARKAAAEKVEVTDKDLEDAIVRVRKMHAPHEGHDHEKMTPEEHEKAIEASMPALDDEFVKRIGDFKDVTDFTAKLRDMLLDDKKQAANEKLRIAIADALEAATRAEIPNVMIESEIDRSEAQFRSDIERMGVKLDDYLKHSKKTLADIRKEWAPSAEKKAKLQLILNAIAKAEKIQPSPKDIEAEVDHIVEHYADADRERAAVYAETVLTNDLVFRFLESQGGTEEKKS